MRLSVHDEKYLFGPDARRLFAEAMKSRKIIFSDLYRSKISNAIRLGLFVPLIPHDKERIPIGLIILRIDPYQFLYPLVQSWPTPSKTAETVLARREGNEVLYLNELRHKKDSVLSFKVSSAKKHLPAVATTQGYKGIFEGKDYRGVPVLSVLRAIPDTPWFLVAKEDAEEVYAPIRERLWHIALIVTALIIGSGMGLGFIWRHQRADFYRRQYEMEHRHSALLERFEYLTRHANDIILLTDGNYRIIEANERAVQSYGYEQDELFQLQLNNLRTPEARELLNAQMEEVKTRNGFVFETQHQRKDGTTFPVEVSSRVIDIEGKKFYQYIIRDITERKKGEEAAQKNEARLRLQIDWMPIGCIIWSPDFRIMTWNTAAEKIFGFTADEVLGKHPYNLIVPKDAQPHVDTIWRRLIEGDTTAYSVNENTTKDGRVITCDWSNTPLKDDGTVIGVLSMVQDITERKRAEESLRIKDNAIESSIGVQAGRIHRES